MIHECHDNWTCNKAWWWCDVKYDRHHIVPSMIRHLYHDLTSENATCLKSWPALQIFAAFTLHIAHCRHCTLHTAHWTLHIVLHIVQCTLKWMMLLQSTAVHYCKTVEWDLAIQWKPVQISTIQCKAVQFSAKQCKPVRFSVEQCDGNSETKEEVGRPTGRYYHLTCGHHSDHHLDHLDFKFEVFCVVSLDLRCEDDRWLDLIEAPAVGRSQLRSSTKH